MLPTILKILSELAILAAVVGFVVYIPELLPRCSMCGKIKPRWCFSIHKNISLSLSRKGNKSVCRKCCFRENINTLSDLYIKKEIKDRVEYKTKYTL